MAARTARLEQDGTQPPFAPRCVKDVAEERLFAHRRELLTQLDLVFRSLLVGKRRVVTCTFLVSLRVVKVAMPAGWVVPFHAGEVEDRFNAATDP